MAMWPQGRPFTVPIHAGPAGPQYYLHDTIDSVHSLPPVNITNSTNGGFPYQDDDAPSTLPALARRKRASKPKVRTGCKTCKVSSIRTVSTHTYLSLHSQGFQDSFADGRPDTDSRQIVDG